MMRRRLGKGRGAGAVACATAAAAAILLSAASAAVPAHAQDGAEGAHGASIKAPLPEARVPSVAVTIFEDGGASVVHKVGKGGHDRAVGLLGGGAGGPDPVGIEVVRADGGGGAVDGFEVSEDGSAVVVPPTGEDVLVRYALEGALEESGPGAYSWSFLYRATTSFTLPDSVDIAFVNGRAVYFTGARTFNCHGCQMDIEFTVDESKSVQRFEVGAVQGQGGPRALDVEVWTSAQVGALALDSASKTIAYEVGRAAEFGGRWVTLLIPPELLGPPYQASINDRRVPVTTFDAGDGRFGVSVRPAEDGVVHITGGAAISERLGDPENGGADRLGDPENGGADRLGDPENGGADRPGGNGDTVALLVALSGLAAGGVGAAVILSKKGAARRRRAPRQGG